MSKCGKGLGKEFALAVLNEEIPHVFTINDLRKFVETKGWNPTEKYINVLLPNSASPDHSKSYPKYFKSIGSGEYVLSDDIRSLL